MVYQLVSLLVALSGLLAEFSMVQSQFSGHCYGGLGHWIMHIRNVYVTEFHGAHLHDGNCLFDRIFGISCGKPVWV